MESAKDVGKNVEVNEYQEALNAIDRLVKVGGANLMWLIGKKYDEDKQTLQECINENVALKEVIKSLRNENFVHILTHNGIKYAFQNRTQVNNFVEKNNLSKVHLISIMYYREKPLDWSEDE